MYVAIMKSMHLSGRFCCGVVCKRRRPILTRQLMDEAIVFIKLSAAHRFEAEATIEFVGARIAGKRIMKKAYIRRSGATKTNTRIHQI